jgi:hypothetical protein
MEFNAGDADAVPVATSASGFTSPVLPKSCPSPHAPGVLEHTDKRCAQASRSASMYGLPLSEAIQPQGFP